MTEPSAPAQALADSPVRAKLAAAAKRAGASSTTRRRTTTTRKTPTQSRNAKAAARGKYANRIAPAVKAGASLIGWRDPVAAAVIQLRADPWAAALDKVAAEDPRVDALLAKVSGLFGKGGAWGEFGKETSLMVGGLLVAGGRVPLQGPAGMVMAMFAGGLVQQATMTVAQNMAEDELTRLHGPDHDVTPDPQRVAFFAQSLEIERAEKVAARTRPADDADQLPDDTVTPPADDEPVPPARPFAAWAA
jgi:hypothetical protein